MNLVDKPVFLVGSERSGTTLLRLMLDHHPKIAFNNESEYFVTQIANDGAYPEISHYHAWLGKHRIFQSSGFVIDTSLDFASLLNNFLTQKRSRENKALVGATVHYEFRKLSRVWPQARYIYLYRDGRDVTNSVVRMGWAGNVYVAADWWLKAEEEWDRVRPALHKDNWIEVRYEDLIADSKSQLERICTFLGVDYSERMFDYVGRSTYQAPDTSLGHQWKTGMRKVDVQRLEQKLGERLLNRGYALSGHPRIAVSVFTKNCLYLQSRINAFIFRLGRYGIPLTMQETVSRRVGLKRMHQNATKRMDRIVNAHRK